MVEGGALNLNSDLAVSLHFCRLGHITNLSSASLHAYLNACRQVERSIRDALFQLSYLSSIIQISVPARDVTV